jgi:NitT/TauT family transport system substrate-binding protein
MDADLTRIKVFPTGMRLNEYVALEEGFYAAEGLDVEIMWDVLKGQMDRWKDEYKERPQDKPFVEGAGAIGSACLWGSISNAGAKMGKFVPDVHGIAQWGIFVKPDSNIHSPEDLNDVPIAVGLRAGSHFNVPYRLEEYLPLEHIKPVNVGGFGARLKALVDDEFVAASLLPPQLDMARELGMREIISAEFKTLWWVPEEYSKDTLRRYFRALNRAEQAIATDPKKFLHLWHYSNPPEFADYDWNYAKFSRGERFVHGPISRDEFDEAMSAVERWHLDDYFEARDFESLALSIA